MESNQRTVNVKITRGELCRLLVMCDVVKANEAVAGNAQNVSSWEELHDKLREQLNAFDETYKERLEQMKAAQIKM